MAKRGFNPVWLMVDLAGNILDDNYYLFVLENDLPYSPATVFKTPDGTPWTNPIQFEGNGTLPNNIYWTESATTLYRLEVRRGNTMSDPLIYLVENYNPNTGAGSASLVSLPSTNQISNPQFVDIDFVSSLELTGASAQTIQISEEWDLVLTGSGNVTITQVPKNSASDSTDSTNAPYALRLALTGWDSAILRQRFQQNGNIWAGLFVANAVTAKAETGNPVISARLKDSNGTAVGSVLAAQALTNDYAEYTGGIRLGDASNTQLPPAAYMDYELLLPGTSDVYLTSIQIVASDTNDLKPSFEQITVDRQIDQTFHSYRDSLLLEAKGDILTGWDFGLNPWQSRSTTLSNVANNTYTADQTILIQQNFVDSGTGNHVSVGRASHTLNYGLTVQSVTATNQFAILQYIDPTTARPYWGKILSSYIRLTARKQNSATLRVKAKLIYRSSLPAATSRTVPVASWTAGGEPVLSAGWSSVTALNNPIYSIVDGENELYFDKFDLSSIPSDNANMTMGLLVYTLDPMIDSGTPDNIVFNKVNLIPNEFASDSVGLTFDEVLRRCQYYYRKSFPQGVVPVQNYGGFGEIGIQTNAPGTASTTGGWVNFDVPMRATSGVSIYAFGGGATAGQLRVGGGASWTATTISQNSNTGFFVAGTPPAGSFIGAATPFNWVANARLGT